jgi:methylmalonyl-CoA decarboxylase
LRTDSDPLGYDEPLERTLRAIRSYAGPVIAMVHGTVWGGAFDVVCSCDRVVADATSTFAITPANLGLPYNTTGLLHLLNRLPLNLIKEMFFTAAPISTPQAKEWQIVNHLVPAAELRDFTLEMARKMTAKAPLSITVVKEQPRILTGFGGRYGKVKILRRASRPSSRSASRFSMGIRWSTPAS